jgi:hypothetical protein
MRPVHYPTLLPGCRQVGSDFRSSREAAMKAPLYAKGQINHYWNKSFQEFVLKKFRGRPSQGVAGDQRSFTNFFEWDVSSSTEPLQQVSVDVLATTKLEYQRLLDLPGIAEGVARVRGTVLHKLDQLDRDLDLRELFSRGGEPRKQAIRQA